MLVTHGTYFPCHPERWVSSKGKQVLIKHTTIVKWDKIITMYQSPAVHMLSLYSYSLSLWGVGRGLEMAPSPCDDLHCLLFHLFLLWLRLLRSAYYVCLQIKTSRSNANKIGLLKRFCYAVSSA